MGRFPGDKRFAFTIFDDTDGSTVDNITPVYRLLRDLGILVTKSVWPLANVPNAKTPGDTLEDKAYVEFVLELQRDGFEIGLHNVRNSDSPRNIVESGLDRFRSIIGAYPRSHCNHDINRENLYWGAARIGSPSVRLAYNLSTGFKYRACFEGHKHYSQYFWGDLCKKRIQYVRNFVFDEINLDLVNPTLPYHDPSRPFVNYWFSSADGGTASSFCRMLSEANQDRLEAEGGVCIMYTHLSAGFSSGRELHPEFERLMRRLAKMNGWFVPVSTLLDHLRERLKTTEIPSGELSSMERRWFFSKLLKGTT